MPDFLFKEYKTEIQFFPNFTEEELKEKMARYNLQTMFKWFKDFDYLETYGECFKYVLFLMNDECIFWEMQGIDANQALMNTLNVDIQILQLFEGCYWTIVVFSLAHEIAPVYLALIGRNALLFFLKLVYKSKNDIYTFINPNHSTI